ncbi:T9SS type A sorting domain-containing protein [Psychroserpens sp. XS_ASV72]|uniref:T9SS type A sorting domain-containing protein n=1 Tax=Psychroserpens sp. XS_ASV72 TaxID=3241293 RepID=UPI003514EBE2
MKHIFFMKTILLSLIFPIFTFAQIQIGDDIIPQPETSAAPTRVVSLSSDGSTVAVGNNVWQGSGIYIDQVRVYRNINNVWTQIGNTIFGENDDDVFGHSVELSCDGNILAISAVLYDGSNIDSGAVTVYEFVNNVWTQIGNTITGGNNNSQSGYSLSLSCAGNVVALGARFSNANGNGSGQVRVYRYISQSWVLIGGVINGEAAGDVSGESVSLSMNGDIVAIGSLNGDGNGHVRIFKYVNNNWTQQGSTIVGVEFNEASGRGLSMNCDGTLVAIGASSNDINGNASGQVRVYKYENDTWTQFGNALNGTNAGDQFGFRVSLSCDGNILAIAAPFNDDDGGSNGAIKIYEQTDNDWSQIGNTIYGDVGDVSGISMDLSSQGNIIAFGGFSGNLDGMLGPARVYDLSSLLSVDSFTVKPLNYSLVNKVFRLKLKENQSLNSITIYNTLGQLLESTSKTSIDLSNYNSDVYIFNISINDVTTIKKILLF